MKILIIHNSYQYKGGEDTVFEAETNLLQRNGHNVKALTFDNKTIKTPFQKIIAALMTPFNFASAKLLQQTIDAFQPEIIHVHNFFPIASPSIFYVARKNNIAIVMTLHNYRLICPNALLYTQNSICEKCIHHSFAIYGVAKGCYRSSKLQTFVLASSTFLHNILGTWRKKIDILITLTPFAQQIFLRSALNVDEKQFIIKPNFVEDYGIGTAKEEYTLFVGRLSEEKGIEILLEAFKQLPYPLYIVGTGPLESLVIECSKQYHNIHYLGHQTKNDVITTMKKAKVVVVPSIVYETFGMIIIEAFSTGTPVLCSNKGAMAEIVENGYSGLHFNLGDANDLSLKLNSFYNDLDTYQHMCINARQVYESTYTPDINYDNLMGIYNDAISSKTNNYQF